MGGAAGLLQHLQGNPTPSFGPYGGAPKDCSGHMKDNKVDWSGGIATVTNYHSAKPGAFNNNFGPNTTNSAGFYGAAYSNAAMSSVQKVLFAASSYGLCKDGISARWGEMPNIDGKSLCFKL